MNIIERDELSKQLKSIAASLDIPDYAYENAVLKYEDVGAWLASEESDLSRYGPEIYPQGSFRLGTVVRPISRQDNYDIDLVCLLNLSKEQTTQANLKAKVGEQLGKRDDLKEILESMRRCWRLNYLAETHLPQFHLDVLPTIPNPDLPPTGIFLTDTDLRKWQQSNPKKYAEWFYGRMTVVFTENLSAVAKSLDADIEDVPEWRVKTPLQIAIQILKRHRDVYFKDDLENRPVSIIITTLAALAYNNQRNIYDALTEMVRDMPQHIKKINGRWSIINPVDPGENFADKWNDYPERERAFSKWLLQARVDFTGVLVKETLSDALGSLKSSLGLLQKGSQLYDVFSEKSLSSSVPLIEAPGLGGIQHLHSPQWKMNVTDKVKVKGTVHHKTTYKRLKAFTIARTVPKDIRLCFEAVTTAKPPYQVIWQVVNTGEEAEVAKQPRGDFYESDSTGSNIRWEYTAYRGTHWVEAFIIKDDICVARSGRTFVRVR